MKDVVIVFGATQGIGLAIVEVLLNNPAIETVYASHRIESDLSSLKKLKKEHSSKLHLVEFEVENEETFSSCFEYVKSQSSKIDTLINCIGILSRNNHGPERSLSDINSQWLTQSFQINAVCTLMLAKYFKPLLQKSKKGVFVTLSAKVGSIEDNKMGGWYSYRMSKAALNMAIKNISIEWNRMDKSCSVFAIHPGTTETNLSGEFIENAKKKYTVHTPKQTAENILKIILQKNYRQLNGKFISWDETEIPW